MITPHPAAAYVNAQAFARDFAPYDRLPIFRVGVLHGYHGQGWCSPGHGIQQKAYDRGLECGRRIRAAADWAAVHLGTGPR